ncbi:MAG: branched-chain amino acid ABC transporter permease [Bdellovibrio sp. CG10_big_fil_rev_8_21_14_0_10_47_8]|nr:MAG: branched-chain amino acid ABC transporter permease [Bdellovibrio sp. CG10_big_fil_rev_8_21_14_0_10_47_8]
MQSMKTPLITFLVLLGIGLFIDIGVNAYIQLILIYILINMILAMSLNLVNGYTGQFSLGHAGFMATGAYTSAYLSTLIPVPAGGLQIFSFLLFAVCGGTMAALAGLVVGLPSLRLKGDYLAIVTLGFGEIIRVVLLNTSAVGGARGMYGISGPTDWTLGEWTVSKFVTGYSHAIFWVLVCFFTLWRLIRSSHGRAFLSVREDEVAAESMGVNTTQTKVRAFVLSSFFAGVAGSIFAHYANYLNPSSFSFMRSVDAVIMVVLGGMGSLTGSIVAAMFITIVPEALRPLQEILGVDIRMVIYSLSLVLLMILRPKGLFGTTEITDIIQWLKRKMSPGASR